MLVRNSSGERKANATWDSLNSSNLAPKSVHKSSNQCHQTQYTSSSRLSNMAKNMSFEKFSQVFSDSASNLCNPNNNSRKLPSSPAAANSVFDLNRNRQRSGGEQLKQIASTSPQQESAAANANVDPQQQLLILQRLQKTLQLNKIVRNEGGESPNTPAQLNETAAIPNLRGSAGTPLNAPNAMASNRRFQSCNNTTSAGLGSGGGGGGGGNAEWNLDAQRNGSNMNNRRLSPSMASNSSFQRSRYSSYSSQSRINMPPAVPENGSTGNQEWGTFPNAAPAPATTQQLSNNAPQQQLQQQQHRKQNSGGANMFQNMLTKNGEIEDLLQTLKSKQGPVTQRGEIQPNGFQLQKPGSSSSSSSLRGARVSASVSCCMNELSSSSLRKTPSHSTLRPSRSILLESKYSNNNLASLCNSNRDNSRSPERSLLRRSSSSVSFCRTDSVAEFSTAEYDKSMWYSEEEEKKMAIQAFIKKQKKAKKKAARRKSLEVVTASSSPASDAPAATTCSTSLPDTSRKQGDFVGATTATNIKDGSSNSIHSSTKKLCSNLSIPPNEPNKLGRTELKLDSNPAVVKQESSLDKMLGKTNDDDIVAGQKKKSSKKPTTTTTTTTSLEEMKGELLVDWVR